MSHHSQDDNPAMREAFAKVFGEYPEGRLNAADEGATVVSIGVSEGKVVMQFPTPTKWIGLYLRTHIKTCAPSSLSCRVSGTMKSSH